MDAEISVFICGRINKTTLAEAQIMLGYAEWICKQHNVRETEKMAAVPACFVTQPEAKEERGGSTECNKN